MKSTTLQLTACDRASGWGQTVLGEHPADRVLPGFLSQNANAATLAAGLQRLVEGGGGLTNGSTTSNLTVNGHLTLGKVVLTTTNAALTTANSADLYAGRFVGAGFDTGNFIGNGSALSNLVGQSHTATASDNALGRNSP